MYLQPLNPFLGVIYQKLFTLIGFGNNDSRVLVLHHLATPLQIHHSINGSCHKDTNTPRNPRQIQPFERASIQHGNEDLEG